jgi:hypothetical protein
LSKEQLLAEIEDILKTTPPHATIRHETPENIAWFGRGTAAIEKWNPSKSTLVKEYLDLFRSNLHVRKTAPGLTKFMTLLNQAQSELRLETVGSEGAASESARALSNQPPSIGEPQLRAQRSPETMRKNVFIGHGRSPVWYQLNRFLIERLHLICDEFNAEAVAGITTTARLQKLLGDADFAFLVMTAEDIHADNSSHARENVIHEAGLFQGRLGFERAIILLEEGCAQFTA